MGHSGLVRELTIRIPPVIARSSLTRWTAWFPFGRNNL
jgi:hypothetical protein